MRSFFLNALRKNDLTIREFFVAIILCSLALPRIINSIAIGLFFLFSLYILIKKKGESFHFHKLSILFLIFFLFSTLTLFWSIDFDSSAKRLTGILSYLLLPLAFSFSLETIRPRKVIYCFVIGVFLVALIMLLQSSLNFISTKDYKVFFYHNLSNNMEKMNAIYFSIFVSFSILFLLLKERTKLDEGMIIFLMAFLVLLSSKTVLFVSIILCLFFLKGRLFSKKNILIGLSLILLSSVFFKKRIVHEINNSNISEVLTKDTFGWQYKWSGLGIRTLQLRVFYELAKEDKFLVHGYGFMAAKKRIEDKHKELKLYSGMIGIDFHNQYLQFIAEIGILGLFIYILIFILLIREGLISKDFLFISFIILTMSICFTEVFLARQRGMVFFITLSLLFYNFHNSSRKLKTN